MFLEIQRAAQQELISVADFVRAALMEKLKQRREKALNCWTRVPEHLPCVWAMLGRAQKAKVCWPEELSQHTLRKRGRDINDQLTTTSRQR